MTIDWSIINSGTEQFPKIFDFQQGVLLRRSHKEGKEWRHEKLDPPLAVRDFGAASRDDQGQVIAEVIRAYCAYTMQVAGRPQAPHSSRDKAHAAAIAKYLLGATTELSEYLRFFHEVRGIGFMNVQVCTWGYLAGEGQIMQHSAYRLQQRTQGRAGASLAPTKPARAGTGHTVNSFEREASVDLATRLRDGGYEVTPAEVQTIDAVLRSPKTWCSKRLREMVEYIQEQNANA